MSERTYAARATAPFAATTRTRPGSLWLADGRKMRRTWLVPLSLLGPLGVTLMGGVLFLLKGPDLTKAVATGKMSGFRVLTGQLGMVQVLAIGLGVALLASMIVDLEHRSDTWKTLFALPISRVRTYVVKFGWTAVLLALSSALMMLGYAVLFLWQPLGPIPWRAIAELGAIVWVACLPLLAFQLLLSTSIKNQALALTVGIMAPVFGMSISNLPAWMPWRLMTESLIWASGGAVAGARSGAYSWGSPWQIVGVAALEVVVLVTIGAVLLARREIR